MTELALGYRRLRVHWNDGTELQLTDAPFEFRLGMGADIRINPYFSLTPLATIGFGSFGTAEWVREDGASEDATDRGDMGDAHGWFTIQIGGHIDLGK